MHSVIKVSQKWRAATVFVVLLLAALLAQACTVGSSEGTQPVSVAGSESPSGILRVAVQPIVQTDPAFISSDPEILVANQIYDYLLDISIENTIEPRLATDWRMSNNGLVYTLELARGVRFHDGSSLTAEDVVWTFNRLRDPQGGLPT